MSDPSGWKQFTDGDVLPADQIRGYLQQGVLVFDNSSQRDSTLVGVVREGMVAYAKDTDAVSYYNGTSWNVITGQIAFASVAARDAAFPSPVDGQYAYITGTETTFLRTGGAWVKVGPNLESPQNARAFTGSTSTTIPAWATKIYYAVVGGGNTGLTNPAVQPQSQGGQVVQGNTTTFTPGGTISITIGGSGANSSISIPGGSTITATGGGGAANSTNGTFLSAPFSGWHGGGGGILTNLQPGVGGDLVWYSSNVGAGGGGVSGGKSAPGASNNGQAGAANTGGGGGGVGWNVGAGATIDGRSPGSGGSGIVWIYFS